MVKKRSVYLGPRLRRLRRELGLTQAEMAADLEVSASYVTLLERNQRPTTADLLMRLAQVYRIDIAELSDADSDSHRTQLEGALKDPLFEGIDIPPLELEDLAASYPGISEAMLRLYSSYSKGQLALADAAAREDGGGGPDPVFAVREFLAAARNHFPALENAATALAERTGGREGFAAYLQSRHGVRVRRLPADVLVGSLRRFDRHRQQLMLADNMDGATQAFQTALQIVYLELQDDITRLLGNHFQGGTAERLARRALANYAAAALLMPYEPFRQEVERRRYDVEALARLFSTSFEQTAHRLTTLQRPGEEGVAFFFIRVDPAGNVSKRLDGAGFPFARHGGACPLWNLHTSFQRPREVMTQWLELPDGKRFFSIARTVTSGGAGHHVPRVERAVALGCAEDQAKRLIYADDDPQGAARATPIGVACRLCQRVDCPARSAPPIGREVLTDEYRRMVTPISVGDR
mgnify:CR=1 FL=1|jgi:hypothetical protein|tara:strand:- start:7533 stop:8930 length:1398 start_codon:yes stop_codon:yes gene_type:complete